MTLYYEILDSPIGPLLMLAGSKGLTAIRFAPAKGEHELPDGAQRGNAILTKAKAQLAEYFAGARTSFDVPVTPEGTEFMQGVWKELVRIPFGETISYGELARRIGNPKASRAVGLANGKNPIPIIIPCHRVIGADGSLTGFAGGIPIKESLLRHEAGSSETQETMFANES